MTDLRAIRRNPEDPDSPVDIWAPDWRRIETHDGSTTEVILGCFVNGQLYFADRGWWEPGEKHEEWDEVEDGIKVRLWEDEDEGHWTSNHCEEQEWTHWAPLRAALSQTKEGE